VKSKSNVLKRLKKLRIRYAKSHIKCSQERKHRNCVYNHEQEPMRRWDPWVLENDVGVEPELIPCHTEIVIASTAEQSSAFYCTYGSEDPENWSGLICDHDGIARKCKWFTPRTNVKEAREEFLRLMEDDKYVYENYRDIAVLQWVLEDRVHKHALSWWERLVIWLCLVFSKPKPPAALPPADDIPEDLWDDSTKNSGT
jgi:hypothetical protein